ncbi:5'/3'-nucleotidase SurE [Pelagicoccus sp. SDUM812002]|uniref:5'/3'-nucleotidase SurE n=1 Tax=Pelagicoccus sp. SDUM812002 TaxID=3041266 RepID=UPI00280E4446|nr:5'/3'-nucleotidase SurE [Pelagicoccus sp. SDUM812002]MDQ8184547.1 5'/3'-nucleotidase SurE [Pelagicoccus sp. SDUM812002]
MSKILIVNDDGIDSPLLLALVSSFQRLGEVVVAAPRYEQSWVAKCMSRFKDIDVIERKDLPCEAYSISGSPADCVNLALGHLLPERPRCVVSGINVGHNAGLAYLLSSGTVGAALEGALHGIPSFAASLGLDRGDYDRLKDNPQALGESLGDKANLAAKILTDFAEQTLAAKEPAYGVVHKINFPSAVIDETTEIIRSNPARTEAGSFFAQKGNAYGFAYCELGENESATPTDRETLIAGKISYSRLDFSQLGRIV